MPENNDNRYVEELKKCVNDEVTVVDEKGDEIKGICLAINFQHLNVVVMTDKEKIIVRNIRRITRKRDPKKK